MKLLKHEHAHLCVLFLLLISTYVADARRWNDLNVKLISSNNNHNHRQKLHYEIDDMEEAEESHNNNSFYSMAEGEKLQFPPHLPRQRHPSLPPRPSPKQTPDHPTVETATRVVHHRRPPRPPLRAIDQSSPASKNGYKRAISPKYNVAWNRTPRSKYGRHSGRSKLLFVSEQTSILNWVYGNSNRLGRMMLLEEN